MKKPSLQVNAISNLTSLVVEIAVGLLLTPFIINHLGKTGYGIWVLIGSFVGYYGLLNLGVGAAVIRYLARYSGQRDYDSMNETASTAMVFFCFAAITAVGISILLGRPIALFFKVQPEQITNFKDVVWILGIAAGISFPGNLFRAIVISHERFLAVNIVQIMSTVIRTLLTVYLLNRGWALLGICWAVFIATIIQFFGNMFLNYYYVPHLRLRLHHAKFSVLKVLLAYGGTTTIIMIADLMKNNLDSFVIGRCINLDEVGVYGVAAMILLVMARIVIASMHPFGPRFANLHGKEKIDEMKQLFIGSLAISSMIAFGQSMLAIILGKFLIIRWVGDGFVDAFSVLWVLSISSAVSHCQNPSVSILYALKKHHFYAIPTVIEGVANLIISILLAPKYGIIGVALGTLIPGLINKGLVMPIYVSRIVGIKLLDYIKQIFIPVITASFITLIAYGTGSVKLVQPSLLSIICYSLLFIILYLAGCLFLSIVFNRSFLKNYKMTAFFTKNGNKS